MFVDSVYRNRRTMLKNTVQSGIIWLHGNQEIGMNYKHNAFPFRQDSSFLYYCGIDIPNLHLLIDIDNDTEILIGDDLTVEQSVWVGNRPTTQDYANWAGIDKTMTTKEMTSYLKSFVSKKIFIHTLPTYHTYQDQLISHIIGNNHSYSIELIQAVVAQRSIKEDREIGEIEQALTVTARAHSVIRKNANAGMTEQGILSKAMQVVIEENCRLAYPAILTIHGETLHSNKYENTLAPGQLLLCDFGVENAMHYASDITRTLPVNHSFTTQQREIYDIVLLAKKKAIEALQPGLAFKDIHLLASKIIAQGLISIGLLQGDIDEIVEKGAHALFFPHGLGHMIGLDVHDMEGLGEKYVGYNQFTEKSEQFGINHLRLGRKLERGNVITVEPGIYFIPQLIQQWKSLQKFKEHISYPKLDSWLDFGGVRLEDNIYISKKGAQVLGPDIPN